MYESAAAADGLNSRVKIVFSGHDYGAAAFNAVFHVSLRRRNKLISMHRSVHERAEMHIAYESIYKYLASNMPLYKEKISKERKIEA